MGYCHKCGDYTFNTINGKPLCSSCIKENLLFDVTCDKEIKEKTKTIYTILTAIIYPLIPISLALLVYIIAESSLIKLILSIVLSISSSVFVILGGLYTLILPLPFIYIYKIGTSKPHLPVKTINLYRILSTILYIFSIFITTPYFQF